MNSKVTFISFCRMLWGHSGHTVSAHRGKHVAITSCCSTNQYLWFWKCPKRCILYAVLYSSFSSATKIRICIKEEKSLSYHWQKRVSFKSKKSLFQTLCAFVDLCWAGDCDKSLKTPHTNVTWSIRIRQSLYPQLTVCKYCVHRRHLYTQEAFQKWSWKSTHKILICIHVMMCASVK